MYSGWTPWQILVNAVAAFGGWAVVLALWGWLVYALVLRPGRG